MNLDEPLPDAYAHLYESVLQAVLTSSKAFDDDAARYVDENGKLEERYDSYFFYYWVGTVPSDPESKKIFRNTLIHVRHADSVWRNSARNGIGNAKAAETLFEISARLNCRTIRQHLAGYLKYAASKGATLFGIRGLENDVHALISHTPLTSESAPVIPPAQKSLKEELNNKFGKAKEPTLDANTAATYRQALARKHGYVRSTAFANAIRLVGAGGEAFTARDVIVSVAQDSFSKPADMLPIWTDVLGHVKARARESGATFHNSLHTRLVDYSIHIAPNTEQKQLQLTLGPLYWEDYAVPRWLTDQMIPSDITKYVDLEQITATGKISGSKLHNILDTATTLATIDGYLLYSRRGRRVSVAADSFTSCIAENISAEKDLSLNEKRNAKLPSPFCAAIRGASEELSKEVSDYLEGNGSCKLICLGLSFDLQAYHPNMLFFGVLPISFAELQKMCREDPGEDFFEGHIEGIHLSQLAKGDYGDIALPDWTGGGKASFLRATEFLAHWAKAERCDWADVVPRLDITGFHYRIT